MNNQPFGVEMKAAALKEAQGKLKDQYQADARSAVQQLRAVGRIDAANLACEILQPTALNPAGLHPSAGGDGTFVCSVEIMLAGLISCAGVTMAAVANSMNIELRSVTVTATGTMDFCGTLAVKRDAPVGLTSIVLDFEIDSPTEADKISKLVELTERYCVVYRTLTGDCSMETSWSSP